MPIPRGYTEKRKMPASRCARGSFRTVRRGRARIVVCCPRGKWKRNRCTVGMRAQSIMVRKRRR